MVAAAANRSQLNELMAASGATQREADAVRQQLASKQQQVEQLALSLADEQARMAALRGQLAATEEAKAGEVEGRLRQMQELSAALQVGALTALHVRELPGALCGRPPDCLLHACCRRSSGWTCRWS